MKKPEVAEAQQERRLTLEPEAGPRAYGQSQELKKDFQSGRKSGSSGPEAAAKT